MAHAFRIGPIETSDGSFFLFAARSPTDEVETVQACDDLEGLRMLSAALPGCSLVVEPQLGKAAKQLGLRRAPLPADVAHEKASLALGLVLRMNELTGGDVGPPLTGDLLDATIEDRELVVETNSRTRADGLRAVLERALGPRIEHRGRERMPAMTAPTSGGKGPLMMDAMASLGLWHKPVELMVREQARCMLDEPSEALGGLTPRAAVAKASSRRALHLWLKELEHAGARSEMPSIATFVREALDLSPTGELAPVDDHTRRTGRGRKVSETLLDFAAPLFEDLRDPEPIRPMLEFAALVWNVDVLEHLREEDASETMEVVAARAGLGEAAQWYGRLRARRRAFADDERIIEVLEVRWEDGDIYIKALARLGPPKPKSRKQPKAATRAVRVGSHGTGRATPRSPSRSRNNRSTTRSPSPSPRARFSS